MTILQIIEERQATLAQTLTFAHVPHAAVVDHRRRAEAKAHAKLQAVAEALMLRLPRALVPYALKQGWIQPPPAAGAVIDKLVKFLDAVASATAQNQSHDQTIYAPEFTAYGFDSAEDGVAKLRKLEDAWLEALRLEIDNGGSMLKIRYYATEVN